MLARPRRWMRAGCPWTSRSCTFGTVSLTASHAVFAWDLVMVSAVITRPSLGAFDCATPACAPPAAATQTSTAPPRQKQREGRSTLRPSVSPSIRRRSVHDRIGHDVLHRVHRLAVHPYLIVQVRPGREPGRADERDLLTALHPLAPDHQDL